MRRIPREFQRMCRSWHSWRTSSPRAYGVASIFRLSSEGVRNRFFRFFECVLQEVGDTCLKLGRPFRFADLIDDDTEVTQVEGNVLNLWSCEDNGLAGGMCQAQLIKHVRIPTAKVGQKNLGLLN